MSAEQSRIADRAARDESDDVADAGTFRCRALTAFSSPISTPRRDHVDDLLAVKAAVLNEDRSCINARQCATGHEQAGDVRLKCLRVVDRRFTVVKLNASCR